MKSKDMKRLRNSFPENKNKGIYIIENNAMVRQTARQFGISKSTVHMVVTK